MTQLIAKQFRQERVNVLRKTATDTPINHLQGKKSSIRICLTETHAMQLHFSIVLLYMKFIQYKTKLHSNCSLLTWVTEVQCLYVFEINSLMREKERLKERERERHAAWQTSTQTYSGELRFYSYNRRYKQANKRTHSLLVCLNFCEQTGEWTITKWEFYRSLSFWFCVCVFVCVSVCLSLSLSFSLSQWSLPRNVAAAAVVAIIIVVVAVVFTAVVVGSKVVYYLFVLYIYIYIYINVLKIIYIKQI